MALKTLTDEDTRIKNIFATFNNNRSSNHIIISDAQVQYNNFIADKTIVDTITNYIPLVRKKDDINYPRNRTNGYASQFANRFDVHLEYESSQH